jgi:hypothetical protein
MLAIIASMALDMARTEAQKLPGIRRTHFCSCDVQRKPSKRRWQKMQAWKVFLGILGRLIGTNI